MNLHTISDHKPTISDYKLSLRFQDSDTALGNGNLRTPWIAPKIIKIHPSRLASLLAHEIRDPITNITLSVEMLSTVITDNELKIYLDIIKRNSIRIDNLINQLLIYQQSDETQAEYYIAGKHPILEE